MKCNKILTIPKYLSESIRVTPLQKIMFFAYLE